MSSPGRSGCLGPSPSRSLSAAATASGLTPRMGPGRKSLLATLSVRLRHKRGEREEKYFVGGDWDMSGRRKMSLQDLIRVS